MTAGSSPFSPDPEFGNPEIDTLGQGWLRLASNTGDQANSVWLDTPIPSAGNNIKVGFDFTMWNASSGVGADGITFFFYDAAVPFSAGGFGGSLGYANRTAVDGLAGGYMGLGLDVYGNFSNPTEGRNGGVGFREEEIVLRGPGSGTTGYEYLAGTGGQNFTVGGNPAISSLAADISFANYSLRPDQDAEDYRYVELELSDSNLLTVRMQVGYSGGLVDLFTADVSSFARPDLLRIGFSGSTGGVNQVYEVRNLRVETSGSTNTWSWTAADGVLWSDNGNWSPASQPASFGEVVFGNSFSEVNGPTSVVIDGSDKTLGNLFFSGQHAYTISPQSSQQLIFDSDGVGDSYITVLNNPFGNANHQIESNLRMENDLRIQHLVSDSLTLSGSVNMQGNDLFLNSSGTLLISGTLSGSGDVTVRGPGTKILSGNNAYTGETFVEQGMLRIESANALGSAAAGTTVSDGASLGLAGGVVFAAEPLTIAGSGNLESGALLNLQDDNVWSGNVTLSEDAAIGAVAGSLDLDSGVLNGAGNTLTFLPQAGTTITVNQTIAGAGSNVIFAGEGTTEIGYFADNTYTGTTTIRSGTVLSNSSVGAYGENAFGNSSSVIQLGDSLTGIANDIALLFNTADQNGNPLWTQQVVGREISVNDFGNSVTLGATGGDSLFFNDAVNLSRDVRIFADTDTTVEFRNTGGGFAGELTGTGDIEITGTGRVVFRGDHDYSGDLRIQQGQLQVIPGAGGALDANGRVIMANVAGADLQIFGDETIANLEGGGNLGGTVGIASGVTLTLGGNGMDSTYGGGFYGPGNVTKTGTGTLTLEGSHSISGAFTVQGGGALALGNDDVLSNPVNITLAGGSGLISNGFSQDFGTLTQTDGYIDFTVGGSSILGFTSVTGSGPLRIDNWAGDFVSGGGDNQFFVSSVLAPSVSNITFQGWGAADAIAVGGGWEIVPDTSSFVEWSGGGANNNWNNNANWVGTHPNSNGARALIGNLDADLDGKNISLNTSRTVGTLAITNQDAAAFTISGTNFTFNSGSTAPVYMTLIGNSSPTISARVVMSNNPLYISNNSSGTFSISGSRLVMGNNGSNSDIYISGNGLTVIDAQLKRQNNTNTNASNGTLHLSGPGTVRLNNANNLYSGGTNLIDGTLQVGSDGALGSGVLAISGGTVQAFGAARSISNNLSLDGDFTISGDHNLTFSGSQNLDWTGTRTISVQDVVATFGGARNLQGTGRLVLDGDGTLDLQSGNNTFSGGLEVAGGTITAGTSSNRVNSAMRLGSVQAGQNFLGTGEIQIGPEGALEIWKSGNSDITLDNSFALKNAGGTLLVDSSGTGGNLNIGTSTASQNASIAQTDGDSVIEIAGGINLNRNSEISVTGGDMTINAGADFITAGVSANAAQISTSGSGSLTVGLTGSANAFVLGQHDRLNVTGANASVNINGGSANSFELLGTVNLFNGGTAVSGVGTTLLGPDVLLNGGSPGTAGVLEVQGDLVISASAGLANAPNLRLQTDTTNEIRAASGTIGSVGWGEISVTGSGVTVLDPSINNIDARQIDIRSGTLILGDDDQISNTTALVLSGGAFATDGFSEVLFSLTLTEDSKIDMGDDSSILKFDALVDSGVYVDGLLTVDNWNGSLQGGGNDQIIFASSLSSQFLNNIYWSDQGIMGAIQLPGGEIVPIPEPGTVIAGILLCAFVAYRERRRIRLPKWLYLK